MEGNTEIGILLGIKEYWPERRDGKPIEQLGATFADVNGEQAISFALSLRSLGYKTCSFRASDKKIGDAELETMKAAKIPIIEYSEEASTEPAVFSASTDGHVQKLLDFVVKEHGLQSIAESISSKVSWLTPTIAERKITEWGPQIVDAPKIIRQELAEVAAKKRWFKSQQLGRDASPFIWEVIQANQNSDLAKTFAKVETWLYE